jgi:hypothetical protein
VLLVGSTWRLGFHGRSVALPGSDPRGLARVPNASTVDSRLKVWLSHLKQGSVFAVRLRHGAGMVVEYTKLPCQTLAGLTEEVAVRMVNAAFLDLPSDGKSSADEILRRQVQV